VSGEWVTLWLAEQREPIRRRVAVKFVEMYSNWDKRERAAQWLAKLQEH